MVQLELFAGIIGVVAILAIFVPITFDPQSLDTGGGNVTQALCSINLGFLGNFTLISCDQPDDTFQLIAGTGIILDGNATTKTIIINSTGGGTVIGTQICPAGEFFDAFFSGTSTFQCTPESVGGGAVEFINNTGIGVELFKNKVGDTFFIKTLVGTGGIIITNSTDEVFINGTDLQIIGTNIGTGSEVFKNKTGTNQLFFRTLQNGTGISITQDGQEITISATGGAVVHSNLGSGKEVFKNETATIVNFRTLQNGSGIILEQTEQEIFIIANITLAEIDTESIANLTQFDNFEWARAPDFSAFAGSSPKLKRDTLPNYKLDVLEFGDKNPPLDRASWTSALPNPFPANGTAQFDVYWYRENTGSGSGICWELGVIGITDMMVVDVSLPTIIKQVCNTSFLSEPVDTLFIETFTFTQAESQLFPKDFIILFVQRDVADVLDDWNREGNMLGVRIVWDTTGGMVIP